jgi:Spy/CpxP family protein refolding chaperone
MNRLLIILALLFVGIFPAVGQEPGAAQVMPDQARQRLEQIKERLTLTPEQVEQVRPIVSDEMQKLKALREKGSGGGSRRDRMKMAREFKRIQDETDDRLKKVLSKEQMNELKKLREERKQELRERAGR